MRGIGRVCRWMALIVALAAYETTAVAGSILLPADIAPFFEAGTTPIALESADLNGDGRADYLLILERPLLDGADDMPTNQRPLLVLIRQPNNSLVVAARNERVVYCARCGGMFGDPFEGIKAKRKRFTVHMYGGSAWRWATNYTFAFSRRDQAWQLVEVSELSYHTSNPDKMDQKVSRPPKDFGKIDFNDFDPETWVGAGVR